jgi:hypothetical protein
MLPPEAEPILVWAMGELRERKHTQVDILDEFNKRLRNLALEIGEPIAPISSSAFNRYTIRAAQTARRLEETRQISEAITAKLGPDAADDLTIMVGETIKTLIFELLESAGEGGGPGGIDTKGAMELAKALHSAVSAQSVSTRRRREVEREFEQRAAKAVDQVAKQKGLTAETVEAIKSQILGVKA